jgi:outer membrane protein assembly factor BamC
VKQVSIDRAVLFDLRGCLSNLLPSPFFDPNLMISFALPQRFARRRSVWLLSLALASLAGCSSVSDMLEPEKIDYKSASKAKSTGSKLEVPPDLTQIKGDSRYTVNDNARGTATASSFNAQRAKAPEQVVQGKVAPSADTSFGIRVERAGSQRWLVAKQSPDVLWPQIKEFWQESGFLLVTETPEAGVMETDWAENRAKIPQDFIRNTIGKVLDSLYSTGERDKFRTRLERTAEGGTEIYISHRGAAEVVTGNKMQERTIWTARPSDPELEAEFLGRLMARLTNQDTPKAALATVHAATAAQERAKLGKDTAGSHLAVEEGFDRAWRRVGLALDRVGFTVEDRDRNRGLYFVRYVDQAADADKKVSEPGFFDRLFKSKDDKKGAQRYRVLVKPENDTRTRVSVQNEQGESAPASNAERILALLNDQLK